ncbi:MAG: hypothetical protein ACE14L_03195 [Terriglobales bacterium]
MTPRVPTDETIKRVLEKSRAMRDKRATAAVSLVLHLSLAPCRLERLRWTDLNPETATIAFRGRDGSQVRPITPLIVQQLLELKRTSRTPLIFGKPDREAPSLSALVTAVLAQAGAPHWRPSDLVRWSRLQTAQVRRALATV